MGHTEGDSETYSVIGAAMAVHSELGSGFLELDYREALCRELGIRRVPHRKEVPLPVHFKGEPLGVSFRVDLLCFDGLIVELKAQPAIGRPEIAQTVNYLKASQLRKALLINFGSARLEYRRLVR